jgi:hypothetical protein
LACPEGFEPSFAPRERAMLPLGIRNEMAGATGLEPAASCVTGRRSNQLNYASAYYVVEFLPIPSRSLLFHLAVL